MIASLVRLPRFYMGKEFLGYLATRSGCELGCASHLITFEVKRERSEI